MSDPVLVVPVQCEALVVNDQLRGRDSFRWWRFNYTSLSHFKSPEPEALDRSTGSPSSGVYLHWTLPRALREGAQNPKTRAVEYPLVPNRWLIVRFSGTAKRQATAWMLESDCPSTDATQSSWYLAEPALINMWKASKDSFRNKVELDANSSRIQVASIGVRFPLKDWTERAPDTMFLTAVAPANPVFTAYYPHNAGVFSFFDDLSGIGQDTLSYAVVGWYSDPEKDILASWKRNTGSPDPYNDLLKSLGWTVQGGAEAKATASVYEGASFSIAWDRKGPPPANDPLQAIRDSGKLNVALGNTTIDAFTALIEQQLKDPVKANLLRAFQYDFLQQLNEVNGEALLQQQVHQSWFGSRPGGRSWTIVPKNSDRDTPADLTATEAQWLLQLNQDQAALDAALNALFSLQWDLNALWLKRGFLADPANTIAGPPAGISNLAQFQGQLAAQLDPANPGSTAHRTVQQIGIVKDLLTKVPLGQGPGGDNSQQAFQHAIAAFSRRKGLPDEKVLKAVVAPRFWQANNPVMLISGVTPPPASDPDKALDVRLSTHLVTGFAAGTKTVNSTTAGGAIPSAGSVSALPAVVSPLLLELFFLDPSGAAAIAAAISFPAGQVADVMKAHAAASYHGVLPDFDLRDWTQPWKPLFIDWKVNYAHIPYETGGHRNWTFDGSGYQFTPAGGMAVENRTVGGISLLSPHAQFVFRARLDKFVKQFGSDNALAALDAWVEQTYQWKFLAQELTGFNQGLALRDARAFRRPSSAETIGAATAYPLADLIGYSGNPISGEYTLPAAYQGAVHDVPYLPNGPAIPFHGVRQGQIYFTDLVLYDGFGRELFVIESSGHSGLFDFKNFPVLLDGALRPDTKVNTNVASVAQLPPRPVQHARLDFRLVDGKDDSKVLGLQPNVNPVCAFILPNHLDNSISLYSPEGASLGEFRLLVDERGNKAGQWQPPPHSSATLDGVPRLRQMLDAAPIRQESNFLAFLMAIDETLWTIDPLGDRGDRNLSVLIGRPLALVRARLKLQLDGQPLRDTGWAATFGSQDPEYLNCKFGIRLGDLATRHDGVIGYFLEANYDTFNSVVSPPSRDQSYVRTIGPLGPSGDRNYIELPFNDQSQAYITLLIDPRASAHAVTGLVPVKQLDIPTQFIEGPLSAMEISFRMGPMLTLIQPTPAQGGVTPAHPLSVTYPLPREQNGAWSWWESDADSGKWAGYDLTNAMPNAQLQDVPNTLREGFLQFLSNLTGDAKKLGR